MREWRFARRERSALWITPAFVTLSSAILAFALSPLSLPPFSLAPSVLFSANSGLLLCFACMLALDGWFSRDSEKEALEIYGLSEYGTLLFVCGKFLSFLLLRGIPTALSVALAVLFYPRLSLSPLSSFFVALPILCLCLVSIASIGLFVAALTLQADARSENALLLSLPLFLAPLIFTIACLSSSLSQANDVILTFLPSLLLLCGTSFLALALLPITAFLLDSTN